MVADGMVIVSGRDATDRKDRFTAFDLQSGDQRWVFQYDAPTDLDYGNTPRATPVWVDGLLITLGATGMLSGLDGQSGVPLWRIDLAQEFAASVPTWGFSASPLVVGDHLFVQVSGDASLVAIDMINGQTQWQVKGAEPAYASMMLDIDGKTILGVDQDGYFARSSKGGELLWSLEPEISGDFGVPSPVVFDAGVVFTGENNGVQLIGRQGDSLAKSRAALNDLLIPDSHTPVLVDETLLVAYDGLHGLDVTDDLAERWSIGESIITTYASIIASPNRVLVMTEEGVLALFEFDDHKAKLLDKQTIASSKSAVLSHPVVVGDRLLVRLGNVVRCFRL